MAIVNWTSVNLKTHTDNAVVLSWAPLTNTNQDGQAVEMPGSADRSVSVSGTFGSGGTVLIEGCNQATPTTWATLNDPSSAALSFTAAKIEAVLRMNSMDQSARLGRRRNDVVDGVDAGAEVAMPKYRIRKDHFLQDPERGLPPQFNHAGAVIEWPACRPCRWSRSMKRRAPRWRGGRKELELRCRTWKRTRPL